MQKGGTVRRARQRNQCRMAFSLPLGGFCIVTQNVGMSAQPPPKPQMQGRGRCGKRRSDEAHEKRNEWFDVAVKER